MINAKEAGKMVNEIQITVSEKCEKAIDEAILNSINNGERNVDISLTAEYCIESDEKLKEYLYGLGFKKIEITSDFPGYCETYTLYTRIKFSF